MVWANQASSPARLIQTSHGAKDLLVSARLKNFSKKRINSYRIGWAFVILNEMDGPKNVDTHIGALMNVPAGIRPADIQQVPAQGIVDSHPDAEQVLFFVSELNFADGTQWRVKKTDIKRWAAQSPWSGR